MTDIKDFENTMDAYVRHMREMGASEPLVQKRKGMILWVCNVLRRNGRCASPAEWDADTVQYIKCNIMANASEGIRKEYYSELMKCASYFDNHIFEAISLEDYSRCSTRARTLTLDDVAKIKSETAGAERLVFHMVAYLGMGYTDIVNLRLDDIYYDHFYIVRRNQVRRTVKPIVFHPDTRDELGEYMCLRELEIKWVKAIDETAKIPERLLIHQSKNELVPYTIAAVHYMMKSLSKRVGIEFDIHMLKTINERDVSDIEQRCMMQHMHQKTLDSYEEFHKYDSCAVNGDEFLQMAMANWHNSPKGQEWCARHEGEFMSNQTKKIKQK